MPVCFVTASATSTALLFTPQLTFMDTHEKLLISLPIICIAISDIELKQIQANISKHLWINKLDRIGKVTGPKWSMNSKKSLIKLRFNVF